jgi:hypothetical protein
MQKTGSFGGYMCKRKLLQKRFNIKVLTAVSRIMPHIIFRTRNWHKNCHV